MDEQSIPAEVPLVGHTVEPVVVRLSDSVTIIHGDCRDCLPIEADAVITDPPYAIGKADWDKEFPEKEIKLWFSFAKTVCVIPGVWSLGKCISAMGENYVWTVAAYHPAGRTNGRIGFSKWMPIVLGGKIKRCGLDAFQFHLMQDIGKNGHPCQKPESVLGWITSRIIDDGATVLDPYMGSGTTGIACIRTGRKFIGIELDAGHFATARARLERELSQGLLDFSGGAVAPTHNTMVHRTDSPQHTAPQQ